MNDIAVSPPRGIQSYATIRKTSEERKSVE